MAELVDARNVSRKAVGSNPTIFSKIIRDEAEMVDAPALGGLNNSR